MNIVKKFLLKENIDITEIEPGIFSTLKNTIPYYDTSSTQMDNILKKIENEEWREVISKEYGQQNKWLFDIVTSTNRAKILDFLTLDKDDNVLDLGAGWGQLTLPLSYKCNVVAVEGTYKRLKFIKEMTKQEKRENIGFLLSNIIDLPFRKEQFDMAFLNGVLEWIGSSRKGEDPRALQKEAVKKIYDLLKPKGRLFVGIENRLGLKYMLGTEDDHTGITDFTYLLFEEASHKYKTLTNSELGVVVYSLNEYIELFKSVGFKGQKYYAMFPDYKLPKVIIPLDNTDALNYFFKNIDIPHEYSGANGRLLECQEKLESLYRSIAKDDIGKHMVPSYGIVLEKGE